MTFSARLVTPLACATIALCVAHVEGAAPDVSDGELTALFVRYYGALKKLLDFISAQRQRQNHAHQNPVPHHSALRHLFAVSIA